MVLMWCDGYGGVERSLRDLAAALDRLLDTFRGEHNSKPFDLFFAYLMDGMVEPGVIDEIRKPGVPTCSFSCNNAHQFHLVEKLSPHFDYNLHSERDAGEKFVAIGANPLWWLMASNPRYFKPRELPRTVEVSFVGANYALRARYIGHLLENGIDVHAYGPGWHPGARPRWRWMAGRYRSLSRALLAFSPESQARASALLAERDFRRALSLPFPANLHLPVPDNELIALYSRSHISLGFLEVYDRHDPSRLVTQHLHLREFEGPMCGALYCTGYTDELADCFEPDKEVIVYRSREELADRAKYYLAHPKEAENVCGAARRRWLAEHTWKHRFEQLFNVISGPSG